MKFALIAIALMLGQNTFAENVQLRERVESQVIHWFAAYHYESDLEFLESHPNLATYDIQAADHFDNNDLSIRISGALTPTFGRIDSTKFRSAIKSKCERASTISCLTDAAVQVIEHSKAI